VARPGEGGSDHTVEGGGRERCEELQHGGLLDVVLPQRVAVFEHAAGKREPLLLLPHDAKLKLWPVENN
jgi:hypothetical protein